MTDHFNVLTLITANYINVYYMIVTTTTTRYLLHNNKMEVATILNLLPLIFGEYQEIQLIEGLAYHFHFDHHLLLLDTNADANRFINNGTVPQTLCVDKVSELQCVHEINSKNTFMIVVAGSSEFEDNFNLLNEMKKMQKLQTNMKIGVFFVQFTSTDDLRKFFLYGVRSTRL